MCKRPRHQLETCRTREQRNEPDPIIPYDVLGEVPNKHSAISSDRTLVTVFREWQLPKASNQNGMNKPNLDRKRDPQSENGVEEANHSMARCAVDGQMRT
jgi:hypothetical protein